MFKSLTLISLVASVAMAQSSTLIPTGISEKCNTFLKELNSDAELAKCTTSLSTALSAFAPGASSASSSAVADALKNVCGDSIDGECSTTVFATKLTAFYAACADELTSKANEDVVKIYDVLYVVPAMRNAVCSKDDSGDWCVAKAAPVAGTSADSLQAALYTKNGDNVVPNISTFNGYNIPFLLLSPQSAECTTCTRNVLNAYIKYESNLPYAPGTSKSQLLSTQSALFSGVTEKCGDNFMNAEVKAAGGLSQGSNSILGGSKNGALSNNGFQSVVATFAGVAALSALL